MYNIMDDYIAKKVNLLSFQDRCTVAKIIHFRNEKILKQNGNGAWCHLRELDENIKKEIFNFIKLKLNS